MRAAWRGGDEERVDRASLAVNIKVGVQYATYLCSTLEEGKGAVGSAEKKAIHTRKGAFWIFIFNVLL
ncbi:hypothetical protein ACP70R_023594 [Stipagrostis hirtigluma subsp. patula]